MGIFDAPDKKHLSRFYNSLEDEDFSIISGLIFHPEKTDAEIQQLYDSFHSDIAGNVLQKIKNELSEKFSVEAYSYIQSKYPTYRQQMLQALYTQSVKDGLANRSAYIESLINWCSSVVALSMQADEQIEAASTEQELYSISVDYSSLDAANPDVTIKEALSIND